MYVEKRKTGKNLKLYLVYSYREKGKIRKIRKYLGKNLEKEALEKAKSEAGKHILTILEELNTKVFLFTLTKNQVERLNKYDSKIKIIHLDAREWQRFTEDFVYNTNAIEGSSVGREEVKEILHKRKTISSDEIETRGVAAAVEYIKNMKEDLSVLLIKKLHELCFKDSKDFAGELRNAEVAVVDSRGKIIHRGVTVSQLKNALNDMLVWYKENKSKFKPLVLAAIIHNQFEYIHPFQDGNGRVGRLLLNFILLKNKYPPINIMLDDRAEYYRTLQEYQNNHNLKPTVEFLIKQYKKTLKKVTTKKEK